MRLSQIFAVLTLAVFRTHLLLLFTTATITKSFLTRTCNKKFFWHFTKKLFWNKHAIEELPTKIKLLQFWFGGIKNIEANVYKVVSS